MSGHRYHREQPSKKPATPRPAISLRTARAAVTGGEVEGAARGGGAALANAGRRVRRLREGGGWRCESLFQL